MLLALLNQHLLQYSPFSQLLIGYILLRQLPIHSSTCLPLTITTIPTTPPNIPQTTPEMIATATTRTQKIISRTIGESIDFPIILLPKSCPFLYHYYSSQSFAIFLMLWGKVLIFKVLIYRSHGVMDYPECLIASPALYQS